LHFTAELRCRYFFHFFGLATVLATFQTHGQFLNNLLVTLKKEEMET
jgi:hypothetical protein